MKNALGLDVCRYCVTPLRNPEVQADFCSETCEREYRRPNMEKTNEPQKVYVVLREYPYEGVSLEAVFATEQAAYAWVARQRRKGQLVVEEQELGP